MWRIGTALACLAWAGRGAFGQAATEGEVAQPVVNSSFMDTTFSLNNEPIILNGQVTELRVFVHEAQPHELVCRAITGHLFTNDDPPQLIQNTTMMQYQPRMAADSILAYPYKFSVEMKPDLYHFEAIAHLYSGRQAYPFKAFSNTIMISDPDISFADPQLLFLILVLGVLGAGFAYLAYRTWTKVLFPQKRRSKDRAALPPKRKSKKE